MAASVTYTLTPRAAGQLAGYSRRVDRELLAEVAPAEFALAFVCGPTPFVENVAEVLVDLGLTGPRQDRTLRIGGKLSGRASTGRQRGGGTPARVFGTEVTIGRGDDGCGAVEAVGAVPCTESAGTVLRCPHCDAVLMLIVEGPGRVWIDLRGSARSVPFSA